MPPAHRDPALAYGSPPATADGLRQQRVQRTLIGNTPQGGRPARDPGKGALTRAAVAAPPVDSLTPQIAFLLKRGGGETDTERLPISLTPPRGKGPLRLKPLAIRHVVSDKPRQIRKQIPRHRAEKPLDKGLRLRRVGGQMS